MAHFAAVCVAAWSLLVVEKGEDCESVGAEYHWYNQNESKVPVSNCKAVLAGKPGNNESYVLEMFSGRNLSLSPGVM
jgi:hypothetical protein